ncbi:hypothetical protein [Nocardiopsis sp. NRRL B-16309]|uniref:hypothetical protein n=1 Tax=Nocardiopsis sp. NRRL B-16309 TaxID=1519494 RepID=UPI0006B067C6|nr:hypothetical protein [Nocardiopsis sp. NRRL B-16309]KOX17522.1 hypothetical protein ADL05_09180 [Nocardiopsis sp. NRRL B-16309]
MNQHPEPHPGPGEPWQQPGGETPGWGLPPEQYHGGALEPYGTGGYQPAGAGPPVPNEAPVATIGDIAISQNMVITPAGRFPIRGTVWTVTDMSRTEHSTPTWAIITAILVFWWTCLLGLLFLLVKDQKTSGHVQVTVQGHGHYHATSIPVSNPGAAFHINQQVNYARSLAA